jgi:hypothetical protein
MVLFPFKCSFFLIISVLLFSYSVLRILDHNARLNDLLSCTSTLIADVVTNTKVVGIVRLKRDGTRAETRFRLSPKRTSPFKPARVSVQSTAGSRGVRISVNNAGYTTFPGSVKSTGYPLHSPVSPSLPLQCVTVCYHIPNAVYQEHFLWVKVAGS